MRNLDANVKVFFKPFYMNSAVSTAKTVEIDENCVSRILVYANEIDKNIPALAEIPFVLNNENYKTFCNKLNKLNVCTRNTDFQDVIDKRVNFPELLSSEVTVRAAFQGHRKLVPEKFDIIRSINCKYLVDADRKSLFPIRCTKQKDVDPFLYQSKTNFRYQNTTKGCKVQKRLEWMPSTKLPSFQLKRQS